ncbi:hypothetical protein EUTSA_v10029239mg [Eutrema salsugineum]|uniref:Malectin-like domain-containing protein n=1 Tax=Eutrema salsugineum TaxID=72664 RepID=V4L272_EUTSA|nr:uncharacterized protein LOC18015164 [Eutrema salsugineum]ESQ37749.1 hypothetical protein EUTSA_v10029239mg [Eutrema salsugineum]
MGSIISANLGLIVFVFCVIFNLQSMVQCINIQDLDDLIRSYAARGNTRRHTGSLYEIPLPSNISDIKASVVTVRNSMFWRKGANFSGIYIPPMVKTTPYAKRIAFVYKSLGDYSSSVYFRLADNYSFVSPVIGFTAYDATNTNDLKKLNLSIKRDNPISIRFDAYVSHNHERRRIKCVAFGDNGLLNFSNIARNYECATTNSRGHYALVVVNQKPKPEPELVRRKWWWFALAVTGISVVVIVVIVVVVKLVRKKRLGEMERESEKSEMIGNIWIGRSRMPAATMVRTQPCLEYHEDLPSSSSRFL